MKEQREKEIEAIHWVLENYNGACEMFIDPVCIQEQITQTQQALDSAVEALKYVNNRIFDLETGRVDLRNNEYLTDSRRIIKAALASIKE